MRRDDIRALHEQRRSIHGQMIELTQKAEGEERDLTGEEQEEFATMETDFEALETRARRAEQLFVQDQQVQKAINSPLELRIDENGAVPLTLAEYRKRKAPEKIQDAPEYRSAWFHWMSTSSSSDLDVEEHRVLSKTVSGGANLVPTDFYNQMIGISRFMGSIGQLATTIQTSAGTALQVPVNSAHGVAVWTAESAAYTPSDETFTQVTLNAFKAASKVIVSEELLTDSFFDLGAYLSQEFGERIGVLENTAFVVGDGTGKPQGIVPNVTQATAAVGNSTTFSYSALVNALYTVPFQYRRNAAWISADGAIKNMRLLVDTQGAPMWQTSLQVGAPDMLLGLPVYADPDMAAPAANAKSLLVGDISRAYMIRRVDGFYMQRQDELHSDNGQVGFRGYHRVDGRVVLAAAAVALAHSAT